MTANVFDRLVALLDRNGVPYRVLTHAAVYTSEEAAQVRGTTLSSGAKALICRTDDRFTMFVLPADRRLANKRVRHIAGVRSLRFANRDEVLGITGLTPGSIPPFGSMFGLATWCDNHLAEQVVINFNAGDHTISVSMTFADFKRVEQPQMGDFAE